MSITKIIPALLAASLLVLATGCGEGASDPGVVVHPLEIDNTTGAPVFKCIALAKDMAELPQDRMVPVKLHPGIAFDAQQVTAHTGCYETVINVHPSVIGAKAITIAPQPATSGLIEVHESITARIEVVWLVEGSAIATLLPAALRMGELLIEVPRLSDFPYIPLGEDEEFMVIEDHDFRNDAPEFEVVTPETLDFTETLPDDEDDGEDDGEDDDHGSDEASAEAGEVDAEILTNPEDTDVSDQEIDV